MSKKVAGRDIFKRSKWAKRMIEKLKEGPALPKDFIASGIPERSTNRTVKVLKEEGMIYQKELKGPYCLPGYENGVPERGRETTIREKNLVFYQSWGWLFKGVVCDKVIVRYDRARRGRYELNYRTG